MHELSLAVSLVEIASEEVERHDGRGVSRIFLKVGQLSGVVKEALLFSFEIAANGTPLENAVLEIEDVPVVIYCSECCSEQTLHTIHLFRCPVCNAVVTDVRSGRELG
jgi:hydrogenase nickel incorporation protein HypA/HybF